MLFVFEDQIQKLLVILGRPTSTLVWYTILASGMIIVKDEISIRELGVLPCLLVQHSISSNKLVFSPPLQQEPDLLTTPLFAKLLDDFKKLFGFFFTPAFLRPTTRLHHLK